MMKIGLGEERAHSDETEGKGRHSEWATDAQLWTNEIGKAVQS
jgi:hypothetical protein